MVLCRGARAQNQWVIVQATAIYARHVEENIARNEAWREQVLQDTIGGRDGSSCGLVLVVFKRVTRWTRQEVVTETTTRHVEPFCVHLQLCMAYVCGLQNDKRIFGSGTYYNKKQEITKRV